MLIESVPVSCARLNCTKSCLPHKREGNACGFECVSVCPHLSRSPSGMSFAVLQLRPRPNKVFSAEQRQLRRQSQSVNGSATVASSQLLALHVVEGAPSGGGSNYLPCEIEEALLGLRALSSRGMQGISNERDV